MRGWFWSLPSGSVEPSQHLASGLCISDPKGTAVGSGSGSLLVLVFGGFDVVIHDQFMTQSGSPWTWHVGGELKEVGLGRYEADPVAALGVPWGASRCCVWGLLAAVL